MLLRDVDVSAVDAAFQARPIALNRVRVGIAPNILFLRVIDALMIEAVDVEATVERRVVRHDARPFTNPFLDLRKNLIAVASRDLAGQYVAVALDYAEHDCLVVMSRAIPTAKEGFINFDDRVGLARAS